VRASIAGGLEIEKTNGCDNRSFEPSFVCLNFYFETHGYAGERRKSPIPDNFSSGFASFASISLGQLRKAEVTIGAPQ